MNATKSVRDEFPITAPSPLAGRLGSVLRIAGHVLAEKITRPVPSDASVIPRSAGAISPRWLSSVLCAGHPGAEIVAVVPGASSNGTTNRQKLEVSYNSIGKVSGLPKHLFIKSTTTLTTRVLNGFSGIIQGEIGFYNQVRPELEIEAPTAYYAAYDPKSFRSIVILDDIAASKGATFCTTSKLISLENMRGIVKLLAHLHGKYYKDPRLDTEFLWLKTPLDFQRQTNAQLNFRKLCDKGTIRSAEVIPPALLPEGDRIWRAFGRSLTLNAEGPQFLLHGDAHVRNFYETRDGSMGACDWQITLKGHWGFDFAYAVISGLTVENRRKWERELLEFYLAELAAAGGPSLEFEDAWLCYRQHTIYPYYGFLTVMGAGSLLPAMQPRGACLEIIRRASTAMVDLDSLAALDV